ncbi:hypothetical protein TGME49_286510 [Toxoplasma gondii ME49]|uniref:GPI biosynthesis family Pig-F protein n=1 Tax=Toxoplasma gondii (strain ATCC 50611 / Me49) TaxID=508771 RepID=S8FBI6_TOXGM|nr:hypothetical protein TGME49_286510 [Toxoplasma gondii ME49]EPT31018.1 hypothetical protein TGME49_286510 [Toxoplasma gondii ME49]|eukprot:XP_002369277.1 hypothetical protein TGME49_286510 [Toxoplasma gondii ME49]
MRESEASPVSGFATGRKKSAAVLSSEPSGASSSEVRENTSGIFAHQLLSLSDLLIAVTNLFILQVTVGTCADRVALIRARQAGASFRESHASSSHAATGTETLPRNTRGDSAEEQSDYSVALAVEDTGGLELAVISVWTLVLVVALKGGTAIYVRSRYATLQGDYEKMSQTAACEESPSEGVRSLGSICRFIVRLGSGRFSLSCLPASASYVCYPGSIAYLYGLWLATISFLPVLLGTPVSQYAACVLFASYLASLGLLCPVAAAVVEEIRRLGVEIEADKGSVTSVRTKHEGLGHGRTKKEKSSPEGVAPPDVLTMPHFLRVVHPYLPECLKARLPFILSPLHLGHLFIVAAFLPFITCSFSAILSCFFLPLDWQTVFIHFPFPLILGGSVGHFVGATVSVLLTCFVLPCLTICQKFLGGSLVAAPVLQDLLLQQRQQEEDSDWEDFEMTETCGGGIYHESGASGKIGGETQLTESSLRRRGRRYAPPYGSDRLS